MICNRGGGGNRYKFTEPGLPDGFDRFNFLFWGEKRWNETTQTKDQYFVGGRKAAFEAGVHMAFGRGRFNYILDFNGDGLLDIFTAHVSN